MATCKLIQKKCNAIHKTIVDEFRAAIVYGRSVKHQGMRVGLTHQLADEDISEYLVPINSKSEILTVMASYDHQAVNLMKQAMA